MAQVAFSIRMDEDLKRDFSQFCNDIGMSMSTAFVVFAKATLQDRQIPFVIGDRRELRRTRQDRLKTKELTCLNAKEAWSQMRAQAQEQYKDRPEPTMDEIDEMIAEVRRERREREAQETSAKAMAV